MLKLLEISKICHIIQRVNSYNLLAKKMLKESLEQFADKIKNLKKYQKVEIELSINGNTKKPSNVNHASVSEHVRKQLLNSLTQLIKVTDQ